MSSVDLLICVVLIFVSAFMSASETALFSLSRFQLRSLKENFRPTHRKIKKLLSDPGGLLITVLMMNEVLNIALSTIITGAISQRTSFQIPHFPDCPEWLVETIVGTVVTAPIILIFCEVTPKVIAAKINQVVATLTASPLNLIYEIFKPLRFLLKQVIRIISQPNSHSYQKAHSKNASNDPILKESDFLLMVEEGHKEGAIEESELELIRNVFELDNTRVAEIATPLAQVLTLPVTTTIKGALAAIRGQKYSRIPVMSLNRKEVLGILYAKDLLRATLSNPDTSSTIAPLMRKPYFVYSTMRLNTLFIKFKQRKTHMAIVLDQNQLVSAIVTMSDLLDVIFENILSDEEDDEYVSVSSLSSIGSSARSTKR